MPFSTNRREQLSNHRLLRYDASPLQDAVIAPQSGLSLANGLHVAVDRGEEGFVPPERVDLVVPGQLERTMPRIGVAVEQGLDETDDELLLVKLDTIEAVTHLDNPAIGRFDAVRRDESGLRTHPEHCALNQDSSRDRFEYIGSRVSNRAHDILK